MEFWQVSRYHVFSTESVIGIPMYVLAYTIVGFIVFGTILVSTGGGKFFLDFASSILGTKPGGPAKVAVISSGFFGSLSGSVISNIVTTGSVTIPTMKKVGYPSHYAAAVEACASTGGTIMPPVMGAVAFVMASLLNVAYIEVAIAALFPAILYFFALYMQIEFYARKTNLVGMDRSEVPQFIAVIKRGIVYLIPIMVLIYILFLKKESQSPFYASLILIALVMIKKETRMSWKSFFDFIVDVGRLLSPP
jgi:TRAP transporter 4TM/12TM fusion protein